MIQRRISPVALSELSGSSQRVQRLKAYPKNAEKNLEHGVKIYSLISSPSAAARTLA